MNTGHGNNRSPSFSTRRFRRLSGCTSPDLTSLKIKSSRDAVERIAENRSEQITRISSEKCSLFLETYCRAIHMKEKYSVCEKESPKRFCFFFVFCWRSIYLLLCVHQFFPIFFIPQFEFIFAKITSSLYIIPFILFAWRNLNLERVGKKSQTG